MSLQIIRRALEKHLAAIAPAMATAFENAGYTPQAGVPYQRANLLPNTPDNSEQGSARYVERGLFQVTLCFAIGSGPADAESRTQALRLAFKRGTSLDESGVMVIVTDTPSVAPAQFDGTHFCIAVSVPWQAQIST